MIKKLIKLLFIIPAVEKQIKKLHKEKLELIKSIHPKMPQQEKAILFCKDNEYEFAIKILHEML